MYLSTNPWKITAAFQCVSSSREEYVALVESLKQNAPKETRPGERRPKVEQGHLNLIQVLEDRLPAIDAELAVSSVWRSAHSTCCERRTPRHFPLGICALKRLNVADPTCPEEDGSTRDFDRPG